MEGGGGPHGALETYAVGSGWQEIVLGDQPAAGANFSLTNPSQFRSRLLSVTFKLVTDANVANRFVSVDYDDGNGRKFSRSGVQAAVAAGTTALFNFNHTRGLAEWNTNNELFVPLDPLFMEPTQKVQINIVNVQVGDQLSLVTLTFERFLTGARR